MRPACSVSLLEAPCSSTSLRIASPHLRAARTNVRGSLQYNACIGNAFAVRNAPRRSGPVLPSRTSVTAQASRSGEASFNDPSQRPDRPWSPLLNALGAVLEKFLAVFGSLAAALSARFNPRERLFPPWLRRVHRVFCYDDLWRRTLTTLFALGLLVAGSHVMLPGYDPAAHAGRDLVGMLSLGGIFQLREGIFLLGNVPFINASLLLSLTHKIMWKTGGKAGKAAVGSVPVLGPAMREMDEIEEAGKAGQTRFKRLTRTFGILFLIYQAFDEANRLSVGSLFGPGNQPDLLLGLPLGFVPYTAITLMAGAAIVERIAALVDDQGLGDGTLLVITSGILSDFYRNFVGLTAACLLGLGGATPAHLAASLACLGLVCGAGWYLAARGSDQVPVVYYRRSKLQSSEVLGYKLEPSVPLKWLPQNMLPVIFASVLIEVFRTALYGVWPAASAALSGYGGALAMVGLVLFFQVNVVLGASAEDVNKTLTMTGARIKGVRPGDDTRRELAARMRAAQVKGGLVLGLLAAGSRALDTWLLTTAGYRLSLEVFLLAVGYIGQASRQIEALKQRPRLEQRYGIALA